MKRRCATSQAHPYVIGIVGLADSYLYHRGVLCYVYGDNPNRWLRILDLWNSASVELVVDIPTLVSKAVLGTRKSLKFKFRLLYHADGITSCLLSFAFSETEHWLLVFNAEEQIIYEPLELDADSISRMFVRNNAEFLYYGTHLVDVGDGFRRWVLQGFSIKENRWFPKKITLSSVVGYEMGVTVCFEIMGDYLYGLSNQTSFEAGESNWMSYYYCFKLPLGTTEPRKSQIMRKHHSWRRHHSEGPIDDRWGFLKLETDETSGKIFIVESRKEWLKGKSGSRITYYSKELVFSGDCNEDWLAADVDEDILDEEIECLNQPEFSVLQARSPHNVHPGDDASTSPFYSRSHTHLRSYQRSSNTFLDLIHSFSTDQSDAQCLHLRAGSRKLKSPSNSQIDYPKPEDQLSVEEQIDMLYHPNQISTWPPQQKSSEPGPIWGGVHNILNPVDYQGKVTATGDERSVVYSTGTGKEEDLHALVYISFDPAAKLHGMQSWERLLPEPVGCGLQSDNDTSMYGLERKDKQLPQPIGGMVAESKGTERDIDVNLGDQLQPNGTDCPLKDEVFPTIPARDGDKGPWARFTRAMYRDLPGKLAFDK